MPPKHIKCDANLDTYPTIKFDLSNVVIGDIHGNAQYLLYLLIKFNVIELRPGQYKRMRQTKYLLVGVD